MVTTEIRAVLAALAAAPDLFVEARFARRAEALDELEIHVLDRLDGLLADRPSAPLAGLRTQALALQSQLEAVDQQLFRRLRATIRAGHYPPDGLRAWLTATVGLAAPPDPTATTSYDSLDTLTNGLFPAPAAPLEAVARPPEMVYYQKTPARIILELATKLTAQDVFYDLGSGLGQVPLLVRLLSGATATGIEIEPTYCHYAQACADALRLTRIRFINADVRAVATPDGTAFFLFTPFTGRILAHVLDQLRQQSRQRPFKVFSYGPGTQELTRQPWLLRLDPPDRPLYSLAEFRSC